MIDIHVEHMLTISAAARELPGRPHVSTVWRWINHGVRGIRLQTVLVGGKRYTSRESLQAFVEQTTVAAAGDTPAARTSRQRQRAIQQAELACKQAGI
jgi:hypothetical protein